MNITAAAARVIPLGSRGATAKAVTAAVTAAALTTTAPAHGEAAVGLGSALDRELGPSTPSYLSACHAREPLLYHVCWATALAALLLTLGLVCGHLLQLHQGPLSGQRERYATVAVCPAVFAILGAFTVLCPRSYILMELLKGLYESHAIQQLGELFLWFAAVQASRDMDVERLRGQHIIDAFAESGPRKYFAVPPCCCLLAPCVSPQHLAARHLVAVHGLLVQYRIVAIAIGPLRLWVMLVVDLPIARSKVLQLITRGSCLLALYGLFILLRSSEVLSESWHTHRKMWAFKGIVLLAMLQEHLATIVAERFAEGGRSCLSWALREEDGGGGIAGDGAHLGHIWFMWLVVLECVPVACAMRWAFPASELLDFRNLAVGVDNALLELAQLKRDEI